jgi:Ca2+-binding RTX toxin-like protein
VQEHRKLPGHCYRRPLLGVLASARGYLLAVASEVRSRSDLPGCPKGGLLSGTDKPDKLAGRDSDDEIRGLGAKDVLIGGLGNDVIYGGAGRDWLLDWPLATEVGGGPSIEIMRAMEAKAGGDDVLYGGDGNDQLGSDKGEDVLYGGDGNDDLTDGDRERERDKLYCGKGKDEYFADKNDYVDSSCESTWVY